jgi:hypothetical protein
MENIENSTEVVILKRDIRSKKFGICFKKGTVGLKETLIGGSIGFKMKSGSTFYISLKEKDFERISFFNVK